jgi:hypothetical protein
MCGDVIDHACRLYILSYDRGIWYLLLVYHTFDVVLLLRHKASISFSCARSRCNSSRDMTASFRMGRMAHDPCQRAFAVQRSVFWLPDFKRGCFGMHTLVRAELTAQGRLLAGTGWARFDAVEEALRACLRPMMQVDIYLA